MSQLKDIVFKSIVEKSIDAIVIINYDGDIIYWNATAEDIFGYTSDEILGKHMHDILPAPNLRQEANEKFEEFQKTGTGFLIGNFIMATASHKNGDVIDVQFGLNTVACEGELFIYAFIRNVSDIIDMRNKYEQLESQATTDVLTGILNRRAFMERSDGALSMARRHKEAFSFLMIDIDSFKSINDQYGHHVGDTALRSFVSIVAKIIRAEDIFGRIGGEEFCISMSKTTSKIALNTAERIKQAVADYMVCVAEVRFSMTVSIGVSSNSEPKGTLDEIMLKADEALYQAKKSGKNKIISK